ncbi:MAG: 4-hydroxy-tetrahydrodipicolinate reductase [Neisseriaceae bacterium]|nr:MAG: 4-hydroxy-tetrahydrodipicolinate reductase [Neisseriaceae bacterium]
MDTKIIISGSNGRMGRALIQSVCANPNTRLVGATSHSSSPIIGQDAGNVIGISTDIMVSNSLNTVLKNTDADVLIDFTRPEATLSYLPLCIENKIAMVIGTTGFSTTEKEEINKSSQSIPIVFSPNFSIGVNLVFALVGLATRTLQSSYDIEIIEAHHRHKVDAPSGTALRIGEVIAENKNVKLEDVAVYSRKGYTGERDPNAIGFSTIRGGDIIGDHTTLFATEGERVEITHKASSRLTFANGAVHAACWLKDKPKGLYSMQDVLNISHLAQ